MKLLFSLLSVLGFYQSSKSQIFDYSEAVFGINAGINYSRVQHAHNPSAARNSVFAGMYVQIPFYREYFWWRGYYHYLHTQLEYYQMGEKGAGKTLYADNYISILCLYRLIFHYNQDNYMFLSAGPRFSVLASQEVKESPLQRPYQINQDGRASPIDTGVVVMGGFCLANQKLDLYLRGDYSFMNRYPDLNEYPATGYPDAAKRKIQYSISLGAGYVLF